MKKILENIKENRKEWLTLKSKTIGSSEISAVAGLNNYKTPLQLWAEKTGRTPADEENEYMELGTHMEPFIGRMYTRRTGRALVANTAMYAHDVHEWATATPDFWEGAETLVEAKNSSLGIWADSVPDFAHIQTQWQLGVTGATKAYIAALVRGSPREFYIHEVNYDASVFDQLLGMADKFIALVKSDTPPEATGGDLSAMHDMYKRQEGKEVTLGAKEEKLIAEYFDLEKQVGILQEAIKPTETRVKALKAQIVQSMGDAAIGKVGERIVKLTHIVTEDRMTKGSNYWRITIK